MSESTNRRASVSTPTRRKLLAGVTMSLGGLALSSTGLGQEMKRRLLVRRNPFTKSRSSKPAANVSNDALSDTKLFNNVTQLSTAM